MIYVPSAENGAAPESAAAVSLLNMRPSMIRLVCNAAVRDAAVDDAAGHDAAACDAAVRDAAVDDAAVHAISSSVENPLLYLRGVSITEIPAA